MTRRAVAAAILALCGTAGHAACDTGLAERMHGLLHPNRALDHERAACEPWRGMPGRFIVLLPLPRPATDPDVMEADLDVLVVQQADNGNTERARIVARLFEPRALVEDDQTIAALKVDTARYVFAPEVRGFGVRTLYRGTSRTQPYESERLALYVPQPRQGNQIAKVLDDLETALDSSVQDGGCGGTFRTLRASVSLVRGAADDGWADLQVRHTTSSSHAIAQGEECATMTQVPTSHVWTFAFDGQRYRRRIDARR
jgi:hypothetical protein